MTFPNQTDGLDLLLSESTVQRPPKARRALILSVITVFVVVIAVIAMLADGGARSAAEAAVESEMANRLPDGAGPIIAIIGGSAFLPQFFSGSIDELDVSFALDDQTLPGLGGSGGAASTLQIDGGILTHDGVVDLLGIPVGYTVTLVPSVEGGTLVLTPTGVEATTDVLSVDLSQIVNLDALTVRACAASLLPVSMRLTAVKAVGSKLEFSVSGRDVPIDLNELKARGSCA